MENRDAKKVSAIIAKYKPEAYFPTLSELIEACGENFGSLDKQHDGWLASANFDQSCFAKTPAEAVARLWLALQKR